MASPFLWPVLEPSALRAPEPVNLGVRDHMLRPTTESPAAKVLGASADPGLVLAVKIVSTMLGGFCLYAALRMTGNVIAQPDFHGAFFLGLFLAMAALGFSFWVPQKYQRRYFAVLGIVIGGMELAINLAIIMKFSSS